MNKSHKRNFEQNEPDKRELTVWFDLWVGGGWEKEDGD